ncbi:MAG: hypothetical protein QNL80_13755 [Akkermansiaceae bacterium]
MMQNQIRHYRVPLCLPKSLKKISRNPFVFQPGRGCLKIQSDHLSLLSQLYRQIPTPGSQLYNPSLEFLTPNPALIPHQKIDHP